MSRHTAMKKMLDQETAEDIDDGELDGTIRQ